MDILLTEQQLASYKSVVEVEPTILSPLPHLVNKAADKEAELPAAVIDVFKKLARVNANCHIEYKDRAVSIDTAVYYSGPDLADSVRLSVLENGVEAVFPADKDKIMEVINLYIGNSPLDRADIELDLGLAEAAVLFAMCDVRRRQKMSGLLGNDSGSITAADIHDALKVKTNRSQWMAPLLILELGKGVPGLKIIEKAFAKVKNDGQIEKLADEFMLINSHTRIRAAVADADEIKQSTDMHVTGGRHGSFLTWGISGKRVQIRSISPAQFLATVDELMRPADKAEGNVSNICSSCNATYQTGDVFCGGCGHKLP